MASLLPSSSSSWPALRRLTLLTYSTWMDPSPREKCVPNGMPYCMRVSMRTTVCTLSQERAHQYSEILHQPGRSNLRRSSRSAFRASWAGFDRHAFACIASHRIASHRIASIAEPSFPTTVSQSVDVFGFDRASHRCALSCRMGHPPRESGPGGGRRMTRMDLATTRQPWTSSTVG